MAKTYAEQLKDPRWQKKRLEVFQRDNWTCQACGNDDETLNVHHFYYVAGKAPWEYPPEALITLCEYCHQEETAVRQQFETGLILILKEKRYLIGDISELALDLAESEVKHG